jgi:hypothetical protein
MDSVAIDSQDYDVYADITTADLYLNAASHAASWRALTDDVDKARYLVTATRLLDRQTWLDTYNTQALRFAETAIINASIELALALLDGSTVQDRQTNAERIKAMTAGSVSITNFRGVDDPTRFPQIVQELLAPYLGGSSSTLGVAVAEGVDTETVFPSALDLSGGDL